MIFDKPLWDFRANWLHPYKIYIFVKLKNLFKKTLRISNERDND